MSDIEVDQPPAGPSGPEAPPTPGRSPDPSHRRGASWLVRSGIVLILAGLGCLGWVGWQMFGTNIASHHRQQQAVQQLQQQWTSGGQPIVRTDSGSATAIVRIPAFGKDYAVPILEGTSDDALAAGFGHYEDTAQPGGLGNFALAGHRITHGEPLRDMPDLKVGDTVEVETKEATYVYRLTTAGDALVVPFTALWVLDKLPTNPQPGGVEPAQEEGQHLLTLTTCSELFHTDNREIAFGVLVNTIPSETNG